MSNDATSKPTTATGGRRAPGSTDWDALAALDDNQVARATATDVDAPALTENELAAMARVSPVKVLREGLGLTQVEFSRTYGIPLGTLRDWEQRRSRPDATAASLLRAIDRDPETMRRLLEPAA